MTTDIQALTPPGDSSAEDFDFAHHRQEAEDAYRRVQGSYEDLALTVKTLLFKALEESVIKVHSIEHRAKSAESFGRKASRALDSEPGTPKYRRPLEQIQDMAGCRVITFFLKDIESVQQVLAEQFDVIEKANRSSYLRGSRRPGYESYHFLVELKETRLALPEYSRFRGMQAEVQLRTILQHAWAEIEHDIQYKSVEVLPESIGRRFMALAGMIEIGDREFQAIADAHEEVRQKDATSIEEGKLSQVELTADALKNYLDKKYGSDGRMRDWSYEWTTQLLKGLGFQSLDQLDECIAPYDDDAVSRAVWGSRQGQLARLELVLLAAMGEERFKAHHPFNSSSDDSVAQWFPASVARQFKKIKTSGIQTGTYIPGRTGDEIVS